MDLFIPPLTRPRCVALSPHAVAAASFPLARRPLAPTPRRLGEERLHRLGVQRAGRDHDRGLCGINPWSYSSSIDLNFRTDRDVEAREPDLRAGEVDVQRVLRIARPEHARKMDTPHFWSAAQALAFLTHKALAKLSNLFHAIENRGALDALRMRDAAYAAKAAAALARGDNIAARVSQSVRRARRPSEDRTNDVLEAFDESTGPFSPPGLRGRLLPLLPA